MFVRKEDVWFGILVVFLVAVSLVWRVAADIPVTDPVTWQVLFDGLGTWKHVGFVIVQVLQVVVPFLPGQATGIAGGYLFGVGLGLAYTMIGTVFGSLVAYWLANRWGRDVLRYVVDPSTLSQWDRRVDEYGVPVFFGMLLLPGFPDDVLCFAAGMADMRYDWYVVSVVLGRLPLFALYTYAGANPGVLVSVEGVLIAGVLSALSGVCFWYRESLFGWLTRKV